MAEPVILPAPVSALVASVLLADHPDVDPGQLYGARLPEARFMAARLAVWLRLREERDERGRRRYTQQRIAEWFGVTRSAVAEAERTA